MGRKRRKGDCVVQTGTCHEGGSNPILEESRMVQRGMKASLQTWEQKEQGKAKEFCSNLKGITPQ